MLLSIIFRKFHQPEVGRSSYYYYHQYYYYYVGVSNYVDTLCDDSNLFCLQTLTATIAQTKFPRLTSPGPLTHYQWSCCWWWESIWAISLEPDVSLESLLRQGTSIRLHVYTNHFLWQILITTWTWCGKY